MENEVRGMFGGVFVLIFKNVCEFVIIIVGFFLRFFMVFLSLYFFVIIVIVLEFRIFFIVCCWGKINFFFGAVLLIGIIKIVKLLGFIKFLIICKFLLIFGMSLVNVFFKLLIFFCCVYDIGKNGILRFDCKNESFFL